MEKTVNATLHNLVDYATDKLFSNENVEHAKDKFYDAKNKFYKTKDKYASKYFTKEDSTKTLLYTGLAIAAAAGVAYLIYKNRETIKQQAMDFVDHVKDMKAEYMNN